VEGSWRRLHDEELHNLYTSRYIRLVKSRRMRWAGECSTDGIEEKCVEYFGWKTRREETAWKTKT